MAASRLIRALVRLALAVPAGVVLALLPLASGPMTSGVLHAPYVPRSPHQAYGYSLVQAGLNRNQAALEWLSAGELALREPERITPPFEVVRALTGAAAAGYVFSVRDGQRAELAATPADAGRELFVELYRSTPAGLELVASVAPPGPSVSAVAPLTIEALEPADYVLRVQPALPAVVSHGKAPASGAALASAAGEYPVQVRVHTAPLLAFPVEGVDGRAIWSGFGAARDGGARAHRGIDIFAPRGTMALAATDGWVVRVETTARGGNVVWLQPLFGNMRLYYAHLHEQFVERGQFVLAGEPIGSVGNTGNAITTPPHLHFGVYVRQRGMRGGARDPVRFLR